MNSTPRHLAAMAIEHPALPAGPAEWFRGYGIMGQPFRSGHVLALRHFASSIGPAYISVWHRDPNNAWTIWTNAETQYSCPRYFSNGAQRIIQAPIHVAWPNPNRITVTINGRLTWNTELATSTATRAMTAMSAAIPAPLWQNRAVLSAMAAVAGPLLGAGKLAMHGITPNGQWFKANPKRIWLVTDSHATLDGTDLGPTGPAPTPAALGDFRLPQRGIFAIGQSYFQA